MNKNEAIHLNPDVLATTEPLTSGQHAQEAPNGEACPLAVIARLLLSVAMEATRTNISGLMVHWMITPVSRL